MEGHSFSDDGTLPADAALVKWGHWIHEAFEKMGRPFLKCEEYKQQLEDAGFVNVELKVVRRPNNDWPKDPRWKEIGKVSPPSPSCFHIAGLQVVVLLLELS